LLPCNREKVRIIMKNITIRILIASFAAMVFISEARAQIVTTDKALLVANNWINTIIRKKGCWGEADSAYVDSIQEFKRGERVLGYFCNVEPAGYIIVSLRREFAPVKAYSARTELEPEMDEGMADFLKGRMVRILDKVEKQFGSVTTARSEDVSGLFKVDYKEAWEQLVVGVPPIEKADVGAEAAADYVDGGNYQEGDELIDARWHQGYPYNLFCPAPPPGSGCTEDRCTVGCNATAGAQVLHYWAWPPTGVGEPYDDEYQWWYMPNQVFDTSPIAQIIAVAELSYEVGIAGQQSYCVNNSCATASHIENMRPGYIAHFRYNPGSWVLYRSVYSASAWFNVIKAQLNKNLPMTYGIAGHAIICDGWQVVSTLMQIHMNWGSGTSSSTRWYTLDVDWPHDPEEHLLGDHYPIPAIGSTVAAGTYPRNSFPYRYFDQDAYAGFSTTFASGNYLQFLHGIRMKANGYIRVESTPSVNTRLFSRGDPGHGIRLLGGTMELYSGGSVKLY
jgi:hypothetical protein